LAQEYSVDIVAKVLGGRAVRALNEELEKSTQLLKANRKAYAGVGAASSKASNNVKQFSRSTKTATASTQGLSNAVRGLGSALASAAIGQRLGNAIGDARQLELSGKRLDMLTKEYAQFAGIQKEAARLADLFQVSVAESSKSLFNLGSRLGASGADLTDIVSVYEGLNSALVVTGRSSQEAAAASYQLAQALGSGSLTGDELKTISETLPELLNEIARAAGKSATEVRQMAKDGELTTDIIIKATSALRDKYGPAVRDNIQVSQRFSNALSGLSEKIGQSLLPVVNPLQETLASLLNVVIKLPDPLIAIGTAATVAAGGFLAISAALSLLGLPGVIALFGKLATTLAAFSGITATVVTGFTAAGGAIKATTVAVNAQTVALGALKTAMAATPWVAAAIAVAAVGYATYQTVDAVNDFNRVLRQSPLKEVEDKIEELEKEIVKAENKTVSWTEQIFDFIFGVDGASTAVDGLSNSIDRLNKRKIQLTDLRPEQGADLDMEEIKRLADIYDPVVPETPKPPTPTGGGGGGAPATDDLESLQATLALKTKLAPLQERINLAVLRGDELTKARLEGEKEMLILMDQQEAALRGLNTEEGKSLQARINQLDLDEQARENAKNLTLKTKELAEAEQQRLETVSATLQPIRDEVELLQAKLNGNEDLIRQNQEILRLKKAIKEAGGTAEDVAEASSLVKERDALRERAEAADKLKESYKQLATSIAASLTSAFRSVVTGAQSAQQALSSAFKGIADAFIGMAMKMIQEWLVMQALGMLKLFGGGVPGGSPTPLVDSLSRNAGSPFEAGKQIPFFGTQQPRMFADGGRPPINQVSVVGEKGPELFVPDTAGTVVSNEDAFGAARSSMRGGASSSGDAFADNAEAISVTNSYAQERIMERERIAAINSSPIDVRAETTVINNVEYVTVEQFAQGMKTSARDAQAKVLSDLRNRPAVRRQVGVK